LFSFELMPPNQGRFSLIVFPFKASCWKLLFDLLLSVFF
jgi:hypothetical protein